MSPSPILPLVQRLRQALVPTPVALGHPRVKPWFWLTLAWAIALALMMITHRWGKPYLIPDDARQHVFWMQRFADPALFPRDLIADYYAAVSPKGFVLLYRGAAWLGIPPLLFNQLLPAGLLVVTSLLMFLVCLELCALPAAGFAAALLSLQSGDLTVNLASGTARAFVYSLMLLFLYGWLRRSRWLSWAAIALQGLIHPQTVLISAGLLVAGVIEGRGRRWRLRSEPVLWQLTLGGLAIAGVAIGYYALSSSGFGPTISGTEALILPEFHGAGRNQFFRPDPMDFLLAGRSGLGLDIVFTPALNLLALVLPLLLAWPKQFPLATSVRPTIRALACIVAAGGIWFLLAHCLLFQLHLPSRYTSRYWMLAAALAGAMALVLLLDALLAWTLGLLSRSPRCHPLTWVPPLLTGSLALALVLALLLYPLTLSTFPSMSLLTGQQPTLYDFFKTQPKDSLIASLTPEANNLPTFAQRSILVGSETAIAYHTGYYDQIQQRAKELIAAQYSSDPQEVRDIITRYGITHWLLPTHAFTLADLHNNRWVQQYQPEANEAGALLMRGEIPALAAVGDRCAVFDSAEYRVLDADCLLTEIGAG